MAAANQQVNPLPGPFQNRFIAPLKFVPDESFLLRMSDIGVQDPQQFIADFMHAAVTLVKTRCLSTLYAFDGKEDACYHNGPLDTYLECVRKLFGHCNPNSYIFATTAENSNTFHQDLNVPVLVLGENGNLFFQDPTEVQVDFALHGDVELLRAEKKRMVNRMKNVKFCYRRVG